MKTFLVAENMIRLRPNLKYFRLQRSSSSLIRNGLCMKPVFHRYMSFKIPQKTHFEKKSETETKDPLMKRIKDELRHYWKGTRKLGRNIRVSSSLLTRMIRRDNLNWSEEKLLKQTLTDTFKIVPFLAVAMIPLSEFLLPIIIKFAPGFLPSTYASTDQKINNIGQLWKTRLKLAKLMQETSKNVMVSEIKEDSEKFKHLVEKLTQGKYLSNSEIIVLGTLLQKEFSLENLSKEQLETMCRYYGLNGIGIGSLWFQNKIRLLKNHLQKLRIDDEKIIKHGLDKLSDEELTKINSDRGMRIVHRRREDLVRQFEDWAELTADESIPPYLVLASRAWNFHLDELPEINIQTDVLESDVLETDVLEPEITEEPLSKQKVEPEPEIETDVEENIENLLEDVENSQHTVEVLEKIADKTKFNIINDQVEKVIKNVEKELETESAEK